MYPYTKYPLTSYGVYDSNMQRQSVFVQKGNNNTIVAKYFRRNRPGWIIQEGRLNHSMVYDFKWLNTSLGIEWGQFKDNKQIINKIQGALQIYANKNGLIKTLQSYENQIIQQQQQSNNSQNSNQTSLKKKDLSQYLKMDDIFPKTFMINIQAKSISQEEKQFLNYNTQGTWILKSCYNNRGRGIDLITDIHSFKKRVFNNKFSNYAIENDRIETHVIQKYLDNPLLLEGKKFDIRCYVLIACTDPFVVLFHHGYVRRSMLTYEPPTDNDQKNIITHLTNQAIQYQHPDYEKLKEDTIWSMDKLTNYLVKTAGFTKEQVIQCYNKMEQVLRQAAYAGFSKITKRFGTFELFGCDIMYDDQLNPILIEMNCGPALACDTKPQTVVIPHVVWCSIDVVFQLNKNKEEAIKKLQNKDYDFKSFSIMINEIDEESESFQDYSILLDDYIYNLYRIRKPLYHIPEKGVDSDDFMNIQEIQKNFEINKHLNSMNKIKHKFNNEARQRFLNNLTQNFKNIQSKYFKAQQNETPDTQQSTGASSSNIESSASEQQQKQQPVNKIDKEQLLDMILQDEKKLKKEITQQDKKLKDEQKQMETHIRNKVKVFMKNNGEELFQQFQKLAIKVSKPFISKPDFDNLVTKKLNLVNKEQESTFTKLFCPQDKQGNINFIYILGEGDIKYLQEMQQLQSTTKSKAYKLAKQTFQKIGKVLEQEQIDLESAFKNFDMDHDGMISEKELYKSLNLMKFNFNKIDVEMIVSVVDLDRDGYISYNEFLMALGKGSLIKNQQIQQQKIQLQRQQTTQIQNSSEKNNKNSQKLKKSNSLQPSQSESLESKGKNTQQLQQQNIQPLKQFKSPHVQQIKTKTFQSIKEVLEEEKVSFKDAFLQMDIDQDNHLSPNDLFISLEMMGFNYSRQDIDDLFKEIKSSLKNKKDLLSLVEFQQMLE